MVKLSGLLICVTASEARIVSDHLAEHIRLTRAEPGCLSFIVELTDDPLVWRVDEAFTDQQAFDAHQTRTRGSDWFKATALIRREFQISTV